MAQARRRHSPVDPGGGGQVVLAPGPRKPPLVPKGSSPQFRTEWRRTWAAPISDAWDESDRPLVERLVALRTRLRVEQEKAPLGVHAACGVLEQQLGLTPRTRRAMGYTLAETDTAAQAVAEIDTARRRRISRSL